MSANFQALGSRFQVQGSKFEVQSLRIKVRVQRAKIKAAILFLFIASVIFACSSGSAKRNEFNIAASKSYEASLFRQNCSVCHGQEANGKELNGTLIPSLRYGEAATLTEDQIYTQIHDGKLPMPSFKNQLTEDEIKKMVKFVRHDLQGKLEERK